MCVCEKNWQYVYKKITNSSRKMVSLKAIGTYNTPTNMINFHKVKVNM